MSRRQPRAVIVGASPNPDATGAVIVVAECPRGPVCGSLDERRGYTGRRPTRPATHVHGGAAGRG